MKNAPYHPRPITPHTPFDFIARRVHFIDHLAPIWLLLPEEMRGLFFVPVHLKEHALSRGIRFPKLHLLPTHTRGGVDVILPGTRNCPVFACAYGDIALAARNRRRTLILMEHGVGLVFLDKNGNTNQGYAGGQGLRQEVSVFLSPNEFINRRTLATYPKAKAFVMGTPKLDPFKDFKPGPKPKDPKVCISFHWDGKAVAPEAGTAFYYYADPRSTCLTTLKENVNLWVHSHPKIQSRVFQHFEKMGVSRIDDFNDVLRNAWLYINDASSTAFEFLVTHKPIVLMNAPHFRKDFYHGIRFWDFTDIGPQVDDRERLTDTVLRMLQKDTYADAREAALELLYPNLGHSAQLGADILESIYRGELR